jgi:hypothetical protein
MVMSNQQTIRSVLKLLVCTDSRGRGCKNKIQNYSIMHFGIFPLTLGAHLSCLFACFNLTIS